MPEPIGTSWTPVRRGALGYFTAVFAILVGIVSGIVLGSDIGHSEGWAVGIGLGLLGWIAGMLVAVVAWLQELVWTVEHGATRIAPQHAPGDSRHGRRS